MWQVQHALCPVLILQNVALDAVGGGLDSLALSGARALSLALAFSFQPATTHPGAALVS